MEKKKRFYRMEILYESQSSSIDFYDDQIIIPVDLINHILDHDLAHLKRSGVVTVEDGYYRYDLKQLTGIRLTKTHNKDEYILKVVGKLIAEVSYYEGYFEDDIFQFKKLNFQQCSAIYRILRLVVEENHKNGVAEDMGRYTKNNYPVVKSQPKQCFNCYWEMDWKTTRNCVITMIVSAFSIIMWVGIVIELDLYRYDVIWAFYAIPFVFLVFQIILVFLYSYVDSESNVSMVWGKLLRIGMEVSESKQLKIGKKLIFHSRNLFYMINVIECIIIYILTQQP